MPCGTFRQLAYLGGNGKSPMAPVAKVHDGRPARTIKAFQESGPRHCCAETLRVVSYDLFIPV